MSDNSKNKKDMPFIGKKPKDYTNDGNTTSQNYKKFNNTKYIKKFHPSNETVKNSTTITDNSQTFFLGDTVEIVEDSKHAGKKGKICIGFALENSSEILNIKFKDGKTEKIEKMYVKKIAEQDYNEE